jgi:hypothetical protein
MADRQRRTRLQPDPARIAGIVLAIWIMLSDGLV